MKKEGKAAPALAKALPGKPSHCLPPCSLGRSLSNASDETLAGWVEMGTKGEIRTPEGRGGNYLLFSRRSSSRRRTWIEEGESCGGDDEHKGSTPPRCPRIRNSLTDLVAASK